MAWPKRIDPEPGLGPIRKVGENAELLQEQFFTMFAQSSGSGCRRHCGDPIVNAVLAGPTQPAREKRETSTMDNSPRFSQKLIDRVQTHATAEGPNISPVPGVSVYRADHRTECSPAIYEPCVIFVVQGSKRGYLDGHTFEYNPSTCLAFSLPMPVEAEILEAIRTNRFSAGEDQAGRSQRHPASVG